MDAEKMAREIVEERACCRGCQTTALQGRIAAALRTARSEAFEEAAKVAEGEPGAHADCGHHPEYFDGRQDAAAAIRAKAKEEG